MHIDLNLALNVRRALAISVVGVVATLSGCNLSNDQKVPPLTVNTEKLDRCLGEKLITSPPKLIASYQFTGTHTFGGYEFPNNLPFAAIKIDPKNSILYAVSISNFFTDGRLSQHHIPDLRPIATKNIGEVSLFATSFDSSARWLATGSGQEATSAMQSSTSRSYLTGRTNLQGIVLWRLPDLDKKANSNYTFYSYLTFIPNEQELLVLDALNFDFFQKSSLTALARDMNYAFADNIFGKSYSVTWLIVAFDSTGQYLAKAGTDGAISIDKLTRKTSEDYSLVTQIELEAVSESSDPRKPLAISFDPSRRSLAVQRTDGLFIYNLSDGKRIYLGAGSVGEHAALMYHPGGKLIAVASQEGVNLFDVDTHTKVSIFSKPAFALDFSDDGRYLAVGDANGAVELYDFCNKP